MLESNERTRSGTHAGARTLHTNCNITAPSHMPIAKDHFTSRIASTPGEHILEKSKNVLLKNVNNGKKYDNSHQTKRRYVQYSQRYWITCSLTDQNRGGKVKGEGTPVLHTPRAREDGEGWEGDRPRNEQFDDPPQTVKQAKNHAIKATEFVCKAINRVINNSTPRSSFHSANLLCKITN